jgi:hypothetical protein
MQTLIHLEYAYIQLYINISTYQLHVLPGPSGYVTGSTFFITFAGEPTAIEKLGISLVTTEPAPTVVPWPMVTPGKMTVFPPIQQSLPMVTSFE